MNRYQSSRRDRAATTAASLSLALAVIVGVLVLLSKLAASVRHSVEQAPGTQQHSLSGPNWHGMAQIVVALAGSPLVWGLALCAVGCVVIGGVRHRG